MRTPKKLPVALTVDEFKKLIQYTKGKHKDYPVQSYKLAFLLGFGAGLRVSEVVNLEKRDIDIKEKKILIRQGKGSKDRIVPLPKGFKDLHINYIPIPVGVRSLQKAFKNAARRAGLLKTKPTLHFHSLRHGFATRSVASGIPIHHVRTLMGHSSIAVTNVYLEANPQDALKSYGDLF